MKTCTKCGIEKPETDFYFKGGRSGQRVSRCKPCTTDDRRSYNREYYLNTRVESENRRNMRLYGITTEQRDAMFEAQGRACAICKTTTGTWAVDHDHACCPGSKTCGKCIRGILCHNCNRALGMVGDSVETLLAAVDYLRK